MQSATTKAADTAADTVAVYCWITEQRNPGLREQDPHAFAVLVHSCTLDFLAWRVMRQIWTLTNTLKADV